MLVPVLTLFAAPAGGSSGMSPLRRPERQSGTFKWCECGTGTQYITLEPSTVTNNTTALAVNVTPFEGNPWLPWRTRSITWRCDGGKGTFEHRAAHDSWWAVVLPKPLSNGEPTKPLLCSALTGQAHVSAWTEGETPASVPFTTGVGLPTLPREYACIKIPVLFHTATGTLLAFAESRMGSCSDFAWTDLVVRRSHDNGDSWSDGALVRTEVGQTIGNAAPVQLRASGRILLPHNLNNSQIWLTYSDDDAASWAPARQLHGVARPGWNWVGTGPPGSIELASGRVLVPGYHAKSRTNNNVCHGFTMLSDDSGASFYLGASAFGAADKHSNECQAVQLANGSVLINARSLANPLEHQQRIQTISTDGGKTFGPTRYVTELPQPIGGCQGSMIRLHNGTLLFSGPDSLLLRTGMRIWRSDSDGTRWRKQEVIDAGSSGYSSLQEMAGGKVGLLYEQSDPNDLVDDVVMTPDRFIFRLL